MRRSSIISIAVLFSGTVRLLAALLGFPTFIFIAAFPTPSRFTISFTPCLTVSVLFSRSISLFSKPNNSPVRNPVLSISIYAAACWYLRLPSLNVLNASALNFSISSGVKIVTVSHSGKFSLFCADRKLLFLIFSMFAIGFFGINSSR